MLYGHFFALPRVIDYKMYTQVTNWRKSLEDEGKNNECRSSYTYLSYNLNIDGRCVFQTDNASIHRAQFLTEWFTKYEDFVNLIQRVLQTPFSMKLGQL